MPLETWHITYLARHGESELLHTQCCATREMMLFHEKRVKKKGWKVISKGKYARREDGPDIQTADKQ